MDQHVTTSQSAALHCGSEIPAQPFFFDGLAGYFHPARGSTAVLLLSPWGYEELCSRKSYRMLGEKLAAAGYPCLRFDFPATGHSSGTAAEQEDTSAWRRAARSALAQLKACSGADRVLVAGQGIGAALAADLAQSEAVAGLLLLAPVAQGRAYLRELAAWTAMTRPTFLVSASDGPEGGLMAGGFVLSRATAEEIKALNLFKMEPPASIPTLLVDRKDHPGDDKLAEHYTAAGVPLERLAFEGYVDYVSDPTLSIAPEATLDAIVGWVGNTFPVAEVSAGCGADLPQTALEPAPGLREDLVRFGHESMFFGALTRPKNGTANTAVILLNSGYDHSIGWARMNVGFARALAAEGAAVLRMDLAGIGESRYWPGQQSQVLYSDKQVEDVRAAIDYLTGTLGAENIILSGRCSGAYLALLATAEDDRVTATFLINPRRLVWNPAEDVDLAIREPIQTLETYGRKALNRETLQRVVSGDINLWSAARKVTTAFARKSDRVLAPVLRRLSTHHRLSSVLHKRLGALKQRGVPVFLLYSENDRGVSELDTWFGDGRKRLKDYPNLTIRFLADADHNLTPFQAREATRAQLLDFVTGEASRFSRDG
ncbi:alpha/beta fold hydrolase [Roseibium sp.]|uniref:alpha/beta fold hydrolase n=1 Tax=Roseibium sp. TaxID=1936156 RepID=UPI003BAE67F2